MLGQGFESSVRFAPRTDGLTRARFCRCHGEETGIADKADVTTYTVKQALAAKVGDHIEIAVER